MNFHESAKEIERRVNLFMDGKAEGAFLVRRDNTFETISKGFESARGCYWNAIKAAQKARADGNGSQANQQFGNAAWNKGLARSFHDALCASADSRALPYSQLESL